SGLAIALVLFAHAGGFGSVFNAVAFHEFRAYNRISPFVGLLSLAAVAIVLDRWLVRQPAYICTFVLAPLLAIAAFDQVPAVLFADQHSREALFHHDQQFIAKLEAQLPGNAMVFQLPNTEFPLDGPRERMLP